MSNVSNFFQSENKDETKEDVFFGTRPLDEIWSTGSQKFQPMKQFLEIEESYKQLPGDDEYFNS